MQEYMFLIRKKSQSTDTLTPERHREFLRGCEHYIDMLKNQGRLISAQPMEWTGKIISLEHTTWHEMSYAATGEVIGGYYHIKAKDFDEALAIAKQNPEFLFNPHTRIEIRPVKMKEEQTGFEYPNG